MNHRYAALIAAIVAATIAGCGKKESAEKPARTTPDGGVAAAAAEAPERALPEGIPDCPGQVALAERTGDGREGGAQILASRPANEIVEHYTVRLAQDGWYVAASERQEGEYHFQFAKDRKFLRMQVAPEKGTGAATRLRLAWGESAAAEELDSRLDGEDEEDVEAPEPPSNEW